MRPRRFVTLVSIALLLLTGSARSIKAASPVGNALSTDRRIVTTTAPSVFFPRVPLFEFGFGDKLHVAGEACVFEPPELNLNDMTLERTARGYAATLIFFAPIRPLQELNGVPISHTVTLKFAPPDGDAITLQLSLTSGKLTVKQGKTKLKLDTDAPIVKIDVDRIYFAIPDTLGIAPDWDLSAEVKISGKEPWCPPIEADRISQYIPPATVGSLTGEDPLGTITFASSAVVDGKRTDKMPDAARIKTLTFEHDAQGGLVAVATMGGDVLDLARTNPEAGTSLRVVLSLASPGFFGIDYPYEVVWNFFPSGNPEPTAKVADPHFSIAQPLGEVPVTVDGDAVRFELGKFTAFPTSSEPLVSTALPVPFGDFVSVFFGTAPMTDGVCLCPPGTEPETETTPVEGETLLQYLVIGNLIEITRLSTGETAYGWIDYDGRFRAENDTELYRGVIKLFPYDDTYEIGVIGSYVRLLDSQQAASQSSSRELTFIDTGVSRSTLAPSMTNSKIVVQLLESDLSDDLLARFVLAGTLFLWRDTNTSAYEGPDLRERSDLLRDIIVTYHVPLDTLKSNPALADQSQTITDQSAGMSSPSGAFGTAPNFWFSARLATPTATGEPFPLPFTLTTPYQPVPVDGDWAIRAGSFWSFPDDTGTHLASVSGPFVDSHLLFASPTRATPVAIVSMSVSTTFAVQTRRRIFSRRSPRKLLPRTRFRCRM